LEETVTDETRIAQEIIGALPAGSVTRLVSDDRDTLRYAVAGMKLRSIVFNRQSLRKLALDAARAVKIEYLQRDLVRSAKKRAEFRYPRLSRLTRKSIRIHRLAVAY
jgi:hypothetical protein